MSYYLSTNYRCIFELTEEFPILTHSQVVESEKIWTVKSAQSTLWHNGISFSCLGLQPENDTLKIKLGKTDYKTYTYSRETMWHNPGVVPVGLCVLLVNIGSNELYLFKRSSKVGTALGKLSLLGGTLTWVPTTSQQFTNVLSAHAITEINEEILISESSTSPKLFGVYYDAMTYRLNFSFVQVVNSCVQLQGEEHTEVVAVATNDLLGFLNENRDNFDTNSITHLLQYGMYVASGR